MHRFILDLTCVLVAVRGVAADDQPSQPRLAKLIAHWPLTVDPGDKVGSNHATSHGGVVFGRVAGREAAEFNGRDGFLEVPHSPALALGRDDFSIALGTPASAPHYHPGRFGQQVTRPGARHQLLRGKQFIGVLWDL